MASLFHNAESCCQECVKGDLEECYREWNWGGDEDRLANGPDSGSGESQLGMDGWATEVSTMRGHSQLVMASRIW